MRDYKIDKTTSELNIFDESFITRLKNYVFLGTLGRYLYYDANNAIDVSTDFMSRLTINGHYDGLSEFFKKPTMMFEDDYVLVFDASEQLPQTLITQKAHNSDDHFVRPKKLKSIGSLIFCKSDNNISISTDQSAQDSHSYFDLLYTKSNPPVTIQASPCGYPIGGYFVRVNKAPGKQPLSVTVYNIYGSETQEPFVKLNYYSC